MLPVVVHRNATSVRGSTHHWTYRTFFGILFLLANLWLLPVHVTAKKKVSEPYFGIRVLDAETGRGVPLIELRTVNSIALYSDSAGWIAFDEPGLMDREVYFAVGGPGYEYPADGFGFRGLRLTPKAGTSATIKVQRTNIAERLYRVTGQGIFRDSTLLGLPVPLDDPNLNAGVLGQDSVQAVPYRGRMFWMWGDTSLQNYPLGNFQMSAATTPLPGHDGFHPERGVPLTYFLDPEHPDRVRRMAPFKEPGVVWLFGLLTVPDDQGQETLLAHYSRRRGLADELEHGLVRFDDEQGVFERIRTFDLDNDWWFPRGNAFRVSQAEGEYFYFAAPLVYTRVKATWDDLIDPDRYEAFVFDPDKRACTWRRGAAPTTQSDERKLLDGGKLSVDEARYAIVDTLSAETVDLHGGSIAWNEFRQKWILIAVEFGQKKSPSAFGEIWYAEAEAPTGPWRKAIKVASHPNYSFYNPRQHPLLDEDSGRVIYFEGTYSHTFSGNPAPTPRYDYNQIMYRLDLTDARLESVH